MRTSSCLPVPGDGLLLLLFVGVALFKTAFFAPGKSEISTLNEKICFYLISLKSGLAGA